MCNRGCHLGLEHYQETIATLSTAAGKELAIEEAIIKIEAQWEELALDLAPHHGQSALLGSPPARPPPCLLRLRAGGSG